MRTRSRRATVLLILLLAAVLVPAASESVGDSDSVLRRVTFTFTPNKPYENVFLAGTFNEWNTGATPMERSGNVFEVALLLSVGEYQYKFVADGEWITDEKAMGFHPDGYGGQNSVVEVDDSFPGVTLEAGDGQIATDRLGHDQYAWEVDPQSDGSVIFRTRVWTGDVEAVTVAWGDGSGHAESMTPMALYDTDGTFDYYAATIGPTTDAGFGYSFVLEDSDRNVHIGSRGIGEAPAEVGLFRYDPAAFPVFETPAWVKEGVIYQIFPERFANGDPANDPDFSEPYYEGLTNLPASRITNGEYFHLVDDWYDVAGLSKSPYRTDGKPDWYSFYGGDIAGVHQHLDYLDDLGVTIIYFNPIFESKSSHKYDAASYTRLDPHFGTNDEFAAFTRACHERGIRVVIDLAFNHTGETFWAFVETRENGPDSPYWLWYEWKKWPLPDGLKSAGSDYYDCWWGFGQMPGVNFDLSRPAAEENSVRDIADAAPNWPVVEHLLAATTYWLTEMGVDGYRLDVSPDVPFWFWELFRERVKRVKPDAYICGELWGSVPDWINGRYYDATMNYAYFREPVLSFIARGDATAAEFDRALAPGRMIYPDEGTRAMMNLLGSHDTERFLRTAGEDTRRLKLALLFSMTYVGVPTIYYGDEIAMTGGGDPDCRRPFHWTWREDEASVDVRAFAKRLIALRREHPCFAHGSFRTLLAEGQVYAYERIAPGDRAIVVLNAGLAEATVRVPLAPAPAHGLWDVLSRTTYPVISTGDGQAVEITLAPLSGTVLFGRKSASER